MPLLLEPLVTPKLTLHNRLVMPPMATAKADADGLVTAELIDYYDEKSRGGALGLVITEHCFVSLQGRNRIGQPSIADDITIDGWKRLVSVLHGNGVKAVMQINHAGGATSRAATGQQTVAPSAITSPIGPGEIPRPLTSDEITGIVGDFGLAARRAKDAGFDGVEIHSAHGYLLDQFYSPLTNRRTDGYGGELANRLRIHAEVIEAVRRAVGEGFPVLLRLGAVDDLPGGTTAADSVRAAQALEAAGVDILDVSGGLSGYMRPGNQEPGYYGDVSAAIRSAVGIPVIVTGGVTEASQAESLLVEGKADLIGVGRALLKDSGWARQAVEELAG